MSRRVRGAALAACLAVLLAGCGTRATDAEIEAGAGGGPVSLPESALAQLRDAIPAATGAPVDDSPAEAAPEAPAVATDSVPGAQSATTATAPDASADTARPRARAPATTGAACPTQGAPVNLGQVGTFSGISGSIAASGRTALAVWAKDINARGGLACHPVAIHSADDGGDPSRAAAKVNELISTRKIVALVASRVAFTVGGFRSAVEAAKIPAIGGELIVPDWHESAWMFPQGASIDDQIIGFLRQGVQAGKTKVALLYCVEASVCSYANKSISGGGAKSAGTEIVYSAPVSLTQTDFTAQCQNAKKAGADLLALGVDGSAMARVARSCAALGYRPLLGGIAGVISPAQAEDANLRAFGLVGSTGTAPWTENDTPGLRAYRTALAAYAPGLPPDGVSAGTWTAAALLEAAVAKLGAKARTQPLSTALILAGLGKIKNETLGGLTAGLTFTPGQKRATSSGCVFYELLTPQGWTAPRGSRPICR